MIHAKAHPINGDLVAVTENESEFAGKIAVQGRFSRGNFLAVLSFHSRPPFSINLTEALRINATVLCSCASSDART
jgi:hypothetical protein